MSPRRVLFLTSEKTPHINCEPAVRDDLAVAVLRQRGVEVIARVWDAEADDDIQPDDLLIARPIDDYTGKVKQFCQWLDTLEKKQLQIINPIPIIRWNMNKTYLLDMAAKGVTIPDTVLLKKDTKKPVLAEFALKWGKIIVKPVIGSKSFLVKFLQSVQEVEEFQETFEELLQEQDYLVQRYIEGITVNGEWSFMFFNHQFSHCVLKMPKKGDFRAHYEFDIAMKLVEPSPAMLATANTIISHVPEKLPYSRVDLMQDLDGRVYLGELELLEPCMFLEYHPEAPRRFADAIGNHLASAAAAL